MARPESDPAHLPGTESIGPRVLAERLADVQSTADTRGIALDRVGVKGVRYPVIVRDRARGEQATVGEFNLYVDLAAGHKGTHMSRFVEILEANKRRIGLKSFSAIAENVREALGARVAHIELSFPYFVEKRAPVSGAPGVMAYRCRLTGRLDDDGFDFVLGVSVPVQTLCPCSKELARVSAHTQRGEVRAQLRHTGFLWIEDVIAMIESAASSPVYSVLRPEDEDHLTRLAFAHPAFVEDVARDVTIAFRDHPAITWFSVEVENFESIHNHSALASVEMRKED
ncbi:GTP cyclohydrolase FolE2 [bacterium]|nr:GTP cyclohydrolase FolE2 [bacterium]